MSIKFTRRIIIACISVLACALLVPIAMRAASTPGVLEACINPGNGGMRLVDSSTPCHNNEDRVSWNITGPAGPPGPTGPAGPTGPTRDQLGQLDRREPPGPQGQRDLRDHLQADHHLFGSARPRIFITAPAQTRLTFMSSMAAVLPPM